MANVKGKKPAKNNSNPGRSGELNATRTEYVMFVLSFRSQRGKLVHHIKSVVSVGNVSVVNIEYLTFLFHTQPDKWQVFVSVSAVLNVDQKRVNPASDPLLTFI